MNADVRTELNRIKFTIDAIINTMTKTQREKFDDIINPKTPQKEVDSGE